MSSKQPNGEGNNWSSDQTERYWEIAVEESIESLNRQNEGFKAKRQVMISFVRYHIIVLGFLFATARLFPQNTESLNIFEISIPAILPLVGIGYSLYGHKQIGVYNIGVYKDRFSKVEYQSDSYIKALQRLTADYDELTEKNKSKLERSNKFINRNAVILGMSLGAALAVVILA